MNNAWEFKIFERGSRPAVICPTDSGTAAKLMPSQGEERNKMAGNSYLVWSHQHKKFFLNPPAEMFHRDASYFDLPETLSCKRMQML